MSVPKPTGFVTLILFLLKLKIESAKTSSIVAIYLSLED